MNAASGVLVGSRHTAESLWAALPDVPGLREKTRLGPPGVDIELSGRGGSGEPRRTRHLVVFVGKFIVSKGVDLLLAAWPLVRARHPEARLEARRLRRVRGRPAAPARGARLAATSTTRARSPASAAAWRAGRRSRCRSSPPSSPTLRPATSRPPGGWPARSSWSAASSTTRWRRCCRDAEALVMPSTFPEAFGMVAVEAAACGALPISAGHSGMLEVSRQLAPELPAERRPADLLRRRGGRRRGARRAHRRLAGAAGGGAGGGPRGPRRDGAAALELGGGRPRSRSPPRGASLTVCRLHRMRDPGPGTRISE